VLGFWDPEARTLGEEGAREDARWRTRSPGNRWCCPAPSAAMHFDHERLDVYGVALDFALFRESRASVSYAP